MVPPVLRSAMERAGAPSVYARPPFNHASRTAFTVKRKCSVPCSCLLGLHSHKTYPIHCTICLLTHRLAPLSEGRLQNGHLTCNYHGWEFDTKGNCLKNPQVCLQALVAFPYWHALQYYMHSMDVASTCWLMAQGLQTVHTCACVAMCGHM